MFVGSVTSPPFSNLVPKAFSLGTRLMNLRHLYFTSFIVLNFQHSGRAVHSYCSKSIDISTRIRKHPGMPGYKKTKSTTHVSDLTSDKFWLFLAIIKNRLQSR